MKYKLNPYYKDSNLDFESLLTLFDTFIVLFNSDKLKFDSQAELLGTGNEAKSYVYRIPNTEFCVKISKFSKHVGKNQQRQFKLSAKCLEAVKNKSVIIEGVVYALDVSHAICVAEDKNYAYTFMYELKNTFRLWDEENIPFKDKDNWEAITEIKNILKDYALKSGIHPEKFLGEMDVNGNNLMVDVGNKIIYLIDPYVPEELK